MVFFQSQVRHKDTGMVCDASRDSEPHAKDMQELFYVCLNCGQCFTLADAEKKAAQTRIDTFEKEQKDKEAREKESKNAGN